MSVNRRVVQVEVERADVEIASDRLWLAGPSAVSETELAGDRVLLTADVADLGVVEGLPAQWQAQVLELDGDAHLDQWRAWARPVRAGRRVVLHPAWLDRADDPGSDDLTVLIDPGRAFGSGSHPSTRLVVAALEEHLRPGDHVLDVGTGSGVLAVVACLLGAAAVVAVDVDPAAVTATVANAAANDVAERVRASTTPLDQVRGTFDGVLANIGAEVLRTSAGALEERVGATGFLVLSGLLVAQADDVVAAFRGLVEVARLSEEGWVAPVLRAPA